MKCSTLTELSSTSSMTTYLDKLELTEENDIANNQRESVSKNGMKSQDFKGDASLMLSGVGKSALGYIGTCDVQTTICTDNVCNEKASETVLAQILESQFESTTSVQSCSPVIDIERSYPLERETQTCHDLDELATKDAHVIKCGGSDTKMNQHSGIISGTGYVPSPLICDELKINESNILDCMDQNKLNTTSGYIGTEQVSHEVMKCDCIGQSEQNCNTSSGYIGTWQVSHDVMKCDWIGLSELNCNTASGYIGTEQASHDVMKCDYIGQSDLNFNTASGYIGTEQVSHEVMKCDYIGQSEQNCNTTSSYIGTWQVSHDVMKCDCIGRSEPNHNIANGYIVTEQVSHDGKCDYNGQSELNCNTANGFIDTEQVSHDVIKCDYIGHSA